MKLKLTKRLVESVEPGDRDIIIYDEAVRGFFVKVTPKGRRVYGVYYRNRSGRERRPILGVHGPSFPTDAARAKAIEMLGEVAKGNDPSAERQAGRNGISIEELCQIYIEEHSKQHKKAGTVAIDQRNIDNHIKPLIGTLKVRDITPADIEKCIRAIVEGRTAREERSDDVLTKRVRGGKGAASRTLTTLKHMLGSFAEMRQLRPLGSNPCQHIKRPETSFSKYGRERFLTPKEYARLGKVLEQAKRERFVPLAAVNAVELYLYTGCRRDEILTLQWAHVDLAALCLRLPDSKTGRKIVPLSAPAATVLGSIDCVPGNPYVIVGAKEKSHFVAIQKAWVKIRNRAHIPDVTIHDLRRSFGSVGAQAGMSLLLVGKALAHKSSRATSVYARLTDDLTRQAVDKIGNAVNEFLRAEFTGGGKPGMDKSNEAA